MLTRPNPSPPFADLEEGVRRPPQPARRPVPPQPDAPDQHLVPRPGARWGRGGGAAATGYCRLWTIAAKIDPSSRRSRTVIPRTTLAAAAVRNRPAQRVKQEWVLGDVEVLPNGLQPRGGCGSLGGGPRGLPGPQQAGRQDEGREQRPERV
jgi:hypothetical protein